MKKEQHKLMSQHVRKMRQWLRKVIVRDVTPLVSDHRLLLEPLEQRQLLAGDVDLFAFDSSPADMPEGEAAEIATTGMVAEGEAAPDLVEFAKQLDDAGVRFFGASWCPACLSQKELFEDGKEFLPYIEVSNPDRTLNEVGQAEGIQTFPTWEFPDGSRETGVLSLETLSQRSGVAIPTSESPSFATVGNQRVAIGSPLHVPIDAYDPNGNPITISVTSSDPSLLEASVLQGNRSLRMSVQGFGDMVFELFEARAPRPTARIIELTNSGFYDATANSEIIFHRVMDDFVLQAGDPTGTGSGGSNLGDFDDQFHKDLQHNRTGVLSYAKSSDDTNDSQFFITEGPQRHLDFNHSIFGQLVEGEKVREAISEMETSSSDRPTTDIVIDSFNVFNDTENGVLLLKPTGNGTGNVNLTITATDSTGNTSTEIITVEVVNDTINTAPFLDDIAEPVTTIEGEPVQIQLTSQDVEGDPVQYVARRIGNVNYTASVDNNTGVVTVTPPADFVGSFDVELSVIQTTSVFPSGAEDIQRVTVDVLPGAPTSVDLQAASDTGSSDSDNVTSASTLSFLVSGVTAGSTVRVLADGTVVGETVASGSTATITTNNIAALGNGTFEITADQITNNQNGGASPAITVVYDSSAPANVTSQVPAQASVDQAYQTDLAHVEESQGLTYELIGGPSGMTIAAESGLVSWTPTAGQTGQQNFTVRLTDKAGNTTEQSFNVNVSDDATVAFRLEAVDGAGNVINQLATGQTFDVNVYVDDVRGVQAQGAFAAYLDLFFDSRLAEPIDSNPLSHGSDYNNATSGSVATDGVIDEFGGTGGNLNPIGGGEFLLGTISMVALRPGSFVIAADPSDDAGHDVLVYGSDTPVPVEDIQFGTLSLSVDATFTANDDVVNLDEDSSNFAIPVLSNDQPEAGTTLQVVAVGNSTAGATLTISNDGSQVLYTPPANYNGGDTFTYTVADQNDAQQTATVTLQVAPVNDAPTGVDDTFEVGTDSSNNLLDVLQNDLQTPDSNETLRVSSVSTTSAGGTLQIGSSGAHILYTPPAGFEGTDTFTYVLKDRVTGGLTDTATVTVTVAPQNPPPIATDDAFTVTEDAAAADFNLIDNDSTDDPNETLSIVSVGTGSNGGSVALLNDGTGITYQPAADFFGTESFVYTLRDSGGAESQGTVVFTVEGVNDPPAAVNDTFTVHQQATNKVLDVLGNDSGGVDGDEDLNITAVSNTSAGGTVTISNNGQEVEYTPPSGSFTGTDTFTYTVSDPDGATKSATVTVEVVEFVPRDFIAEFQFNGLVSARIAIGAEVTLSGTDEFGNAVNETAHVGADGKIRFEDQPPGTYTLTLKKIPFLTGAQSDQQLQFTSELNGTDLDDMSFDVGGLHAKYISIEDFVSYTPRESVLVGIAPGDNDIFVIEPADLGGVDDPSLSLSADGSQITVHAQRNGSNVQTQLNVNGSRELVQVRGEEDGYVLLRVTTGTDHVTYATVSASASAEGEAAAATGLVGEGEAAAVSAGATLALPLPGTGELFTTDGTRLRDDEPARAENVGDAAPMTTHDGVIAEYDPESVAVSELEDPEGEDDRSVEAIDAFWADLADPLS